MKIIIKWLMISLAILALTIACNSSDEKIIEWQLLFNGESLDGWNVIGGKANYIIEDSILICSIDEGVDASFLSTNKNYDNFILEYEVKIDSNLNSGVQIRSHVWEKDTITNYNSSWRGMFKKKWREGEVWGYQIDLDPTPRAWSGGFYEEGNRGWLVTLTDNPDAQKAFKRGEWNHFRIKANGNKIQTWVNGVSAVNTTDDLSSDGFIALQVHKAKEKQAGKKIFWRNIWILKLP